MSTLITMRVMPGDKSRKSNPCSRSLLNRSIALMSAVVTTLPDAKWIPQPGRGLLSRSSSEVDAPTRASTTPTTM
eukprot:CAMPEP_0181176660 /NCGR_PEP_ID=MMETSP1096-20121128/4749_1 /TAXON_ID=156174 ORGANISM="Chrysochromulina ericina, Strain CCMP281" /NCGR_SAMPLE_ID=MMETSP1096 /ASSEMBLY_ACC=CAM_ASM_000453 /LENGTH=74 /DNA_ID=CAMNT_0023264765 /DNA_START=485 /DNA_END=709 /DNA_ORIENTATION=+